jgi:hypothetical protein
MFSSSLGPSYEFWVPVGGMLLLQRAMHSKNRSVITEYLQFCEIYFSIRPVNFSRISSSSHSIATDPWPILAKFPWLAMLNDLNLSSLVVRVPVLSAKT